MNSQNESLSRLKIRLAVSFGLLLFAMGGFAFFFQKMNQNHSAAGTSPVIRHSFIWNEQVWKILKSNKRMSVKKPVPSGKDPRVNGLVGLKNSIDVSHYKVEIESGNKSFALPVGAFYALKKSSYATDFRCIEGWSEETEYSGVTFSEFLDHYQIGKKADGTYYSYVALETPDREYYVSIDMESMLHPQTVLAYEMNGKPLSLQNGYPIRLMIPIKYGIKSLKRIGKISFSDERPKDYWAERGYDWYSGL